MTEAKAYEIAAACLHHFEGHDVVVESQRAADSVVGALRAAAAQARAEALREAADFVDRGGLFWAISTHAAADRIRSLAAGGPKSETEDGTP